MTILDSLPNIVNGALGSVFLSATLSRTTRAAGPNDYTPGAETTATYACKAIHETFGVSWLANGMVDADEVKVLILAASLSVEPLPGDKITIRGVTYTIVPAGAGRAAVMTDPAKAVWECRARK